jgi:hypothetical protein
MGIANLYLSSQCLLLHDLHGGGFCGRDCDHGCGHGLYDGDDHGRDHDGYGRDDGDYDRGRCGHDGHDGDDHHAHHDDGDDVLHANEPKQNFSSTFAAKGFLKRGMV